MPPDFIDVSPGEKAVRLDFPVRAARRFVFVIFAFMTMPPLWLAWQVYRSTGPSRRIGFVITAVFLVMDLIGILIVRAVLGRRPRALIARDQHLVLVRDRGDDLVPWTLVTGLDQTSVRGIPSHVVLFRDGTSLSIGLGDDAQRMSRAIATRAGLRWIEEPFRARRPD